MGKSIVLLRLFRDSSRKHAPFLQSFANTWARSPSLICSPTGTRHVFNPDSRPGSGALMANSLRRGREKRRMPQFGCPNREFRMNANLRSQDLTLSMTSHLQSTIHIAFV